MNRRIEKDRPAMDRSKKYYIVSENILPDAILKTALVKELLARGEASTINEAVDKVGLSRSAFYKYRDGIYPFFQGSKEKIITLSMILEHRTGVLSDVLNTLAGTKGNVLTINQNIPLQNLASVSISVDTADIEDNVEEIIHKLSSIEGVKKVEIVGQS